MHASATLWRRGRSVAALAAALALVLAVSACGGSDSSTSSESTASAGGGESTGSTGSEESSGSSIATEAQAFVEENSQPPSSIGAFEPLSKAPPKGLTFVGVGNGDPTGQLVVDGMQEAAEALGWKFQFVEGGSTPDTVTPAWNQLVAIAPDAIGSVGVPTELFERQLNTLVKGGTLHVSLGLPEEVGPGLIADISSAPTYQERGEWMAKWVIADSEGEGTVLNVSLADFPILEVSQDALDEEIKKCSGCAVEDLDVPGTAIGKELPQEVVSAIQRNPDIDYIAVGFGDMTTGMPEALAAAGLTDKVHLISANPSPRNLEGIANGSEAAAVGEGTKMTGWLEVDAVARKKVGDELPLESYAKVPLQFIDSGNIGTIDPSQPFEGVPGFREQFEELWHVGK